MQAMIRSRLGTRGRMLDADAEDAFESLPPAQRGGRSIPFERRSATVRSCIIPPCTPGAAAAGAESRVTTRPDAPFGEIPCSSRSSN